MDPGAAKGTKYMTTDDPLDHDDPSDAPGRAHDQNMGNTYKIEIANGDLRFQTFRIDDPVPLGRQILQTANLDPRDGVSLMAILPSGDFEDMRLDERFDLRGRGTERFVAFRTDRDFKLTLNDAQLEWGKPVISGAVLYGLAEVGEGEAIYREVRGGEDELIEPTDLIDLDKPGIERFITAPRTAAGFEIRVNSRPRTVPTKQVSFEQVVQLAFSGAHEANVVFSMTYRHAASTPPAGELGAGGTVEVKRKGTVFNVTRTVQS